MTSFLLNRTIDEELLSIRFTKTNVESFNIIVGRLNDAGGINTHTGLNVSIEKIGTGAGPSTVYKILPYNIEVAIYRGAGHNLLRIIEREPAPSGWDDLFAFDADVPVNFSDYIKRKLDKLIEDLPKRPIRSAGRNLVGLREVGEGLGLPENVESRIGSFLSGKRGSAASQTNKLRQNLGESLAPRPGGGGKRTRRRRRQ